MLFQIDMIGQIEGMIKKSDYIRKSYHEMKEEVRSFHKKWWLDYYVILENQRMKAAQGTVGPTMRYGNMRRDLTISLLKHAFVCKIEGIDAHELHKEIFSYLCKQSFQVQGKFDGWKSDLWTADMGVNLSLYLSLEQAYFTEREVSEMKKLLFEKSFTPLYEEWVSPSHHVHCLDTMGHNWWSVCVSAAGIVLLSQDRESISNYDTMLIEITEALKEWLAYKGNVFLNKRANFGVEGDFVEYLGYMGYALDNFITFYQCLEEKGLEALIEIDSYLEKSPDFILENILWCEGNYEGASFGDSRLKDKHMYSFFYLCKRYERGDLLEVITKIRPICETVMEIIAFPKDLKSKPLDLPNMAIYETSGHAVMRTGFGKEDLACIIKTGDSWNHNHLDVGSFELSYRGEKIITDSGTCSYGNDNYRDYYIKAKAHNTVCLDGEGQWEKMMYEGTKFPGNFPAHLDHPDFQMILADCTGAYGKIYQRNYRFIIRFDETCFCIIDDIQTYKEGTLENRYFTYGTDIEIMSQSIANIKSKNSFSYVIFPYHQDSDISIVKGYLHAHAEGVNKEEFMPESRGILCKTKTEGLRAKVITLLHMQRESECCVIDPRETDQVYDFQIKLGSKVHRFIINKHADGRIMHRNAWVDYSGIITDGFITYLCESESTLQSFACYNASMLKVNEKLLHSSFSKQTIYLETDEKKHGKTV